MVSCWAANCKHYNVRETCRFFRFPTKDIKERKRWIRLLRRKEEPGPGAFVCSCHFRDGKKENGPEIFEHNKNKRFDFPDLSNTRCRKKKPNHKPATSTSCSTSTSTQLARMGSKVELLNGAIPTIKILVHDKKDVTVNNNITEIVVCNQPEVANIKTEDLDIDDDPLDLNNFKIEPETENDEEINVGRCRVCLQDGKLKLNALLCGKFQIVTKIDINLSVPQYICGNCLERLEIAYSFIEAAKNGERLLNKNLTQIDHTYAKREIETEEINGKCWKCKICTLKFKTRGLLQVHKNNHSFECKKCCIRFKSIQMFNEHYREMREKGGKCKLIFHPNKKLIQKKKIRYYDGQVVQKVNVSEIIQKTQSVQKSKTVKICEYCAEIFQSRFLFRLHLKTHKENVFGNELQINKEVVEDREKSWKCKICKEKFKTRGLLKIHFKNHTFKCKKCLVVFEKLTTFKRHRATHNGEYEKEEKTIECKTEEKECLQIVDCLPKLKDDEKICEYCSKVFKSGLLFNLHVNIHKLVTEH